MTENGKPHGLPQEAGIPPERAKDIPRRTNGRGPGTGGPSPGRAEVHAGAGRRAAEGRFPRADRVLNRLPGVSE